MGLHVGFEWKLISSKNRYDILTRDLSIQPLCTNNGNAQLQNNSLSRNGPCTFTLRPFKHGDV
jgi:hypothetical protein